MTEKDLQIQDLKAENERLKRQMEELIENNLDPIEMCKVSIALDKLKEYQNLEEQGLLKKQLYKEGQLVWCVDEYEYSGLLFVGTCGEYVMVAPEFVHCATDFDRQLEEMCEESQEDLTNDIKIYHKDSVYSTRTEAQAALEKMKAGGVNG